jgi:hypothetical protein
MPLPLWGMILGISTLNSLQRLAEMLLFLCPPSSDLAISLLAQLQASRCTFTVNLPVKKSEAQSGLSNRHFISHDQ